MSCQIKLSADITDVAGIRRYLFPTDDNRGTDGWLQNCHVSVSPTGDLIVIGHGKKLVVLYGKWDSNAGKNQYQASQDVHFHDFKDDIQAVLCLPIVVQSQSSQVGPDWTCIIIGFDTGYVTFLTEDCAVLLEEQLHNEPIACIKCQSQHSPRPDISPELKPEELYIIYPSNVCVINGVHIFTILRNCRSQLAKGGDQSTEPMLLSANLKKWGFTDQAVVNDVALVGLDLSNTFDHLQTASICGGFGSKYRAMPPHNNLVLGIGSKPFIGFHYALEGGTQQVLTDVAKAVANKLKSALPGWLTGAKTTPEKTQSVSTLPAEVMACRFGLCDLRRTATRIILSPDRKLAAISDTLGRVILIDTHRGVALRIFKGYRDAQCAFIQVPDERKNRHSPKLAIALFLIIYSSKKGTLEIFCAQQGTKITTFTASKNSILVYINYGLMGFQNTSKSRYVCQYTCVLIDPDGQIKEIVIPFHYALTEKNSKRARDLHLYKRLKHFIKNGEYDQEKLFFETVNTCGELKTIEVRSQCLEMLAGCKEIHPEILIKITEVFLEKLGDLDNETKQLKIFSENIACLSRFYSFLAQITSSEELDEKNGNVHLEQSRVLLPEKEMNNLQRLLDLSTLKDSLEKPKVTFESNSVFTVSEFISIFDYGTDKEIKLKSDVEEMKLFRGAEMIFGKYITRNNDYESLEEYARSSRILPTDFFNLLLQYWVNRFLDVHVNLEKEMGNFSRTLLTLTKLIDPGKLTVEYNCLSTFWEDIREILVNSAKPFPALMAAMLCKTVVQKIEAEKDANTIDDDSIEIWEKLSQENCQWTLLIGKLEDVSLLNIILSNKPTCEPVLPKLHFETKDVSLKIILEKGRGSVSELVAQWLTLGGVSPEHIILNDLGKEQEPDTPSETPMEQPVFHYLNIIRKQFPHSVEPSVLLTNMSWEYALTWQKNIQEIKHLEAVIKCLNYIPSLHIKAGLYNLIWNTHLKIIFESGCKLINKVGKLPKERLCRQDTDLTDYQITIFFELCLGFFDSFLETLVECENYEKPVLRYEAIWENGGRPLAELALSQNEVNYDLVHLHHQLAMVIHMVTVFAVKHTKLMNNLFDVSVVSLFFTDFQQKIAINWHKTDSKVNASRLQFLIKVISASMDTLTIDDGKIYSMEHVAWMSKCLSLARVWNLDVDLLKRYQIAQIYANGFDALGEELLSTVTDRNKLGPDLVTIAGKRLSQLLSSSQDLGEKIAAFSTPLTKYLDTLNGDWCSPSNLESITVLITHCLRCLEESQSEYKTACLMLEACSTLQDLT